LEEGGGPGPSLASRHAPSPRGEGHVVEGAQVREQEVVLRDEAEAPVLGRHEDVGWRVEVGAVEGDPPGVEGEVPATAASSVLLPAPFGPTTAVTVPLATARSTTRSRAPRRTRTSASRVMACAATGLG